MHRCDARISISNGELSRRDSQRSDGAHQQSGAYQSESVLSDIQTLREAGVLGNIQSGFEERGSIPKF
jgi:hypothetical protein